MPGWIYDSAGNARPINVLSLYDAAGNPRSAIGGWVYDGAGNARQFISPPRWVMDFSGPNHTCGGRTGPCASVITASCYTPMGSVTYVSGTPPVAPFRLAHVKNTSPSAAGEFVLWVNDTVVDPYILGARIISIGGQAENATVTLHLYDSTVSSYGYLFSPINQVIAPATSYEIVFS